MINQTDGGPGTPGRVQSEDTRKRRIATMNSDPVRKKIIEAIPRGESHHASRKVRCIETGMVFDTISAAVVWLKQQGKIKAAHNAISHVCRGRYKQAYGYKWNYANQ